jgi:hypothetical protein
MIYCRLTNETHESCNLISSVINGSIDCRSRVWNSWLTRYFGDLFEPYQGVVQQGTMNMSRGIHHFPTIPLAV